jgi:hypothetical protein
MKHKWHKEIKAWANGAEIQFLDGVVWLDAGDPEWNYDCTYRIKPQPKEPQYLYVWKNNLEEYKFTENEPHPLTTIANKVWKPIGKIKLEVDDD